MEKIQVHSKPSLIGVNGVKASIPLRSYLLLP